jgi:hypothetical protein
MMFLVTYEINTLPFNTLVLADSQEEAEKLAGEGIQKEAGAGSEWKILKVEEVDLDAEHYMEF